MAYIDSSGMFGGDRMAMLSDSARLAWPWFWCASNSVGRIELNYRSFVANAFRQFKKPPTEQTFWDWVSEYHECFLMFAYKYESKVWGQWDVSEKYLPTYKTKSDEKTPPPMAGPFIEWQKRYLAIKESSLSGKCRVFNVSDKDQNISKDFEHSPVCVDLGVDLGVNSGKIIKPSSAETAEMGEPALFAVSTPYGKAWFDREHDRWYKQAFWNRVNRVKSRSAYEKAAKCLVHENSMTHGQAAEFLFNAAVLDHQQSQGTSDWDWRQNMHPTTWLNGRRWQDERRARDPPSAKSKQQLSMDQWDEIEIRPQPRTT